MTEFSAVAPAVASCTSITLDSITVPGGSSLDLTDLQQGSTVTFAGTTSFEYFDWDGDLNKISGKDITITSASGAIIDGNGQAWWDGQGSNGGVAK